MGNAFTKTSYQKLSQNINKDKENLGHMQDDQYSKNHPFNDEGITKAAS